MIWTPGQTLLKQYTVQRLLGRGGMGEVYRVTRDIPGKTIEFAVKTLLLRRSGDHHRKAFIGELRTWIELPGHPFITECYFYKTIEGRLAIFSEFVSGGTLKDWIYRNRVGTVDKILDTAIQIAMGFSIAHDCGVIHQDVKPGNILMTAEGTPKITDFGIARMKTVDSEMQSDVSETSANGPRNVTTADMQSTLVTSGGLTPAYGSPEQFQHQRVGRATDIWSLGIIIFEMFNRGISWKLGIQVPLILEKYRQAPTGIPIPDPLYEILQRCFAEDPSHRWESMDALANALKSACPDITGRDYSGLNPDPVRYCRAVGELQRKSRGFNLLNPLKWLRRAYELDGQDPSQCPVQTLPETGSAMVRLLAYLEIYSTAESMIAWLIEQGRKDLREDYVCLLFEKYIVHHNTDDRSGAVECLDQLSNVLREMLREEPEDWVLESRLGVTLMEKAGLIQLETPKEALELLRTIIPIFESLRNRPEPIKNLENLCRAYTVAANAATRRGNTAEAMKFYNAAERVAREKMERSGKPADADYVLILMNRADLDKTRSNRRIQKDYLDALKILNHLDQKKMSHDAIGLKVVCSIGYAELQIREGLYEEALKMINAALQLVEMIIQRDGWRDLLEELGTLKVHAAECLIALDRMDEAETFLREGLTALEKNYFKYDNIRSVQFLGRAYRVQADILHRRGRTPEALKTLDDAENMLVYAMEVQGQSYLNRHIQLVDDLRGAIHG